MLDLKKIRIFISKYDEGEREEQELVGYLFMRRCVSSPLPPPGQAGQSNACQKQPLCIYNLLLLSIYKPSDFCNCGQNIRQTVFCGGGGSRALKCSFCTLCFALLCFVRYDWSSLCHGVLLQAHHNIRWLLRYNMPASSVSFSFSPTR